MSLFDEMSLEARLSRGMERVMQVLGEAKNPLFASSVPHSYDDKFLLCEFMTKCAVNSILNALAVMGMNIKPNTESRAALHVKRRERCTFERKATRQVEQPTAILKTKGEETIKKTIVTNVTEYFWNFHVEHSIELTIGETREVLAQRSFTTTLMTPHEATPYPTDSVKPVQSFNVSWLFNHMREDLTGDFKIDRTSPKCHTPVRCEEVDEAVVFMSGLLQWCQTLYRSVADVIIVTRQEGVDVTGVVKHTDNVFVPVVPFLPANGEPLDNMTVGALCVEQKRSLSSALENISLMLPDETTTTPFTIAEGRILLAARHIVNVAREYRNAVASIESLLREQLVMAIGKEVTSDDFTAYMKYHHTKIYKDAYKPRGFSHAIKTDGQDHEGTVTIYQDKEPITTISKQYAPQEYIPLRFALDAASEVRMESSVRVHSYVSHKFSTEPRRGLTLTASAKQFSGYVMMVGRISSSGVFLPKHAMVVKNKDYLEIPLLLEEIPSAQKFRNTIQSLSPEQQAFAKAYRDMQLEATLFGIVTVQIKPHLEILLNLPPHSLTKEIKLTQELLDMFITYHIPSGVLAYCCDTCEDEEEIATSVKVQQVKERVKEMKEVLRESKEHEVHEARLQAQAQDPFNGATQSMCQSENPMSGMFYAQATHPTPAAPLAVQMMQPMASPSLFQHHHHHHHHQHQLHPQLQQAQPCLAPGSMGLEDLLGVTAEESAEPAQAIEENEKEIGEIGEGEECEETGDSDVIDLSRVPKVLEESFVASGLHDLSPCIVQTGKTWVKREQKKLLGKPVSVMLEAKEQLTQTEMAFDLLASLTKSGELCLDASVDILMAHVHSFDETLMNTVIQKNINPIQKLELSSVTTSSILYKKPIFNFLKPSQAKRLETNMLKVQFGFLNEM